MPRLEDASSKRWLTVLAVTVAASVIFVAYSFIQTLSPPASSVVAPQKSTAPSTEEPPARVEPDWNTVPAGPGGQAATAQADPFAAQNAAAAKAAAANDPVARQKIVHEQADYLRNLIAQGKLPECFGNLTKEQVNEMEQKGLTIQ